MPADGRRQPTRRRSRRNPTVARQLLAAAERLIAERGFLAVRLEDIGAAAGVSGPAIYRHFPNKEALLVELLVGISTRLLAGAHGRGGRRADDAGDGAGRADRLPPRLRARRVGPDPHPGPRPGQPARRGQAAGAPQAQRQYVEIWVDVLRRAAIRTSTEADARLMAHAAFGLLNSTPHSVKPGAAKAGRGQLARPSCGR